MIITSLVASYSKMRDETTSVCAAADKSAIGEMRGVVGFCCSSSRCTVEQQDC